MADIVTIQTPSLGDRSYLVTDGATAFVVDPQRDIDRVLALTAGRGISVTHVFETHIHNDYVTGGLALARATGAAYHVNAADRWRSTGSRSATATWCRSGASMRVRVIATPGHTFTHLAYALEDAATGEVIAVFTGGSLLHGSAGRPDLLGAEHAPALAAAQRRRCGGWLASCPTRPWSTPRTGSAASARPAPAASGGDGSTIGAERRVNPALALDEDAYVSRHAGRPGRLPGLLRPDGPGQRGRADRPRPGPARRVRGRADQAADRRRASGWWTCATGGRSRPGTCPGRSASSTATTWSPTSAGCCRRAPR